MMWNSSLWLREYCTVSAGLRLPNHWYAEALVVAPYRSLGKVTESVGLHSSQLTEVVKGIPAPAPES